MIKKKYNKTLKLLFLSLALISSVEPCFAAELNMAANGSTGGIAPTTSEFTASDGMTYSFEYKQSTSVNKTIIMDAINLNGNSLLNDSISVNEQFKAGTWIGSNVTEHQVATYTLYKSESQGSFVNFKQKKYKYTCSYTTTDKNQCPFEEHNKSKGYCESFCPYNTWCEQKTGQSTNPKPAIPKPGLPSNKQNGPITLPVSVIPIEIDTTNCHCSCELNSNDHPIQCPATVKTGQTNEWTEAYVKEGENSSVPDCPADYKGTNGVTYNSKNHSSTLENAGGKADRSIIYESVSVSAAIRDEAINHVLSEARGKARSALGGGAVAQVKYIKQNNDYSVFEECQENGGSECYGYLTGVSVNGIYDVAVTATIGDAYQEAAAIDYQFIPSNICMNPRTSYITYRTGDCQDEEMTISNIDLNGKIYWRYFIPLNAKSDSEFWLKIGEGSNSVISKAECQYIIEDKPNDYKNYISPIDNTREFIGDYYTGDFDKEIIERDNACQVSVTIDFPIVQRFYNEIDVSGTKKFKGFNFYYKPIDINNPFPNGLTGDDNLWKDWYTNYQNGNEVKPNISKSYENISYIASIPNPSVIRNYNKNNSYADWSNIGLDGRSSFIGSGVESLGVITRQNDNLYPVHKLGCGKSNTDPSNSIMYMEECGDAS